MTSVTTNPEVKDRPQYGTFGPCHSTKELLPASGDVLGLHQSREARQARQAAIRGGSERAEQVVTPQQSQPEASASDLRQANTDTPSHAHGVN